MYKTKILIPPDIRCDGNCNSGGAYCDGDCDG